MKCPVCKPKPLMAEEIEVHLPGASCPSCHGHWVHGSDYSAWLEKKGDISLVTNHEGEELVARDVKVAKICPSCFRILSRYQVGQDTDFYLDRCTCCGGIWFDGNEWEILRDRGLHEELNKIFTRSYQRNLRDQSSRETMKQHYREKFGETDYYELQRVKMWLETHERRDELLAYLCDEDPLKA